MEEEVKNARARLAERFANNNIQIGGKGSPIISNHNDLLRNSEEEEEAR